MKKYNVEVVVKYNYEVEVEDREEAEAEGWNYEDWKHCSEVYSINTSLEDETCEGCEEWESDCTCEEEQTEGDE